MDTIANWKVTSQGNYVYNGDKFYVSYAPNPWLGNSDETALYGETIDGVWYILRGDWRESYEKLVPLGFQACLDFYKSKKDEFRCNRWSTDETE